VGYLCQGTETACAATPQGDDLNAVKVQKVQSWHLAPPGDVSGAFCYHGQGGKHDDSAASRGCEWCLFCW
jgi:hypothetical protein